MTDHEHEDPKFDAWLREQSRWYNAARRTPREEMWARIQEARRAPPVLALRPWARWALAAAATLVLGIGIGRWTATDADGPAAGAPVAANGGGAANPDVAYSVVATEYLSRTEAFLTGFRADLRDGQLSPRFGGQARELLSTTRLMLDSPAADNARLRLLLQDLELVLVQIAQLETREASPDTDLITQGMDQSNVLPKLRSAIPAGPVPVRSEGVSL